MTIRNAKVHDKKFNKGLYIKYKPFKEDEFTTTETAMNTQFPEFNHSKRFDFQSVTQEHLDWFDQGCISFLLYGRQEDSDPDATRTRMTTKVQNRHFKLGQLGSYDVIICVMYLLALLAFLLNILCCFLWLVEVSYSEWSFNAWMRMSFEFIEDDLLECLVVFVPVVGVQSQ